MAETLETLSPHLAGLLHWQLVLMKSWPAQPPEISQVYVEICDGPSGKVGTFALTFVLILAVASLSWWGILFVFPMC